MADARSTGGSQSHGAAPPAPSPWAPPEAPPTVGPRPERPRRRLPLALAAVASVVVVVVTVALVLVGGGDEDRSTPGSQPSVRSGTGLRPAGSVVIGYAPAEVVQGAGSLWVVDLGSGDPVTIQRVDPQRMAVVATISLSESPYGGGSDLRMAFADGALWVAADARGHLLRIDPATNAISGSVAIPGLRQLTAGGGALWVSASEPGGQVELLRVDPAALAVTDRFPLASDAAELAFAGGVVWAVLHEPQLVTIDPRTGDVETLAVGEKPISLAAHGDTVWVADNLDGTVREVGAGTGAITEIDIGGRLTRVWVDERTLWVENAQDQVVRVDRATGARHRPLSVPFATGLTSDGTDVWISGNPSAVRGAAPTGALLRFRLA